MNINTRLIRPLRNGQITLPADFRRALHLDEFPLIQITLDNGELRLRPYDPHRLEVAADWLRALYHLYAPVRRSLAADDEHHINRLISVAIATLKGGRHAPRRS